jgi:HEPN domain-containing protein
LSEYDLKTAKAMLESRRYLYVVFTCQQAIEKILKSFYVKEIKETPPYTHNLIRLIEKLSFKSFISEKDILFLEELNSYYIESRYTETLSSISK